jgi:hypothetical protein
MFRQLCAIHRELVCTFWVTCQFGILVAKILCSMWLYVCYYINIRLFINFMIRLRWMWMDYEVLRASHDNRFLGRKSISIPTEQQK